MSHLSYVILVNYSLLELWIIMSWKIFHHSITTGLLRVKIFQYSLTELWIIMFLEKFFITQ